jgi:DNA polymerase-1
LENQTRIYEQIESPLIPLLAEMEAHGVRTDCDYLNELSKQLEVSIEKTQAAIYDMAGEQFNIGSPKQLGEVLFGKLEIPGSRKTKTGYSTSADILLELAPSYPIISEILSYRELTKLKSTYADALPKLVREDGRIHTTYNQAIAATGRLSSVEPNLQNIPIRTEMGRKIRKAFVASEGCRLLSFDYSQIELRILAHMCEDEALVSAFQTGLDVHRATAAQMFHKEPDEVSREERGYAKLLNYAVLYGVTDFGLKQQLGENFSRAEAKELIQKYNERFPRVRDFMDETVEDARSKGFTTTLWGRRRYFADIHAGNRVQRAGAERQAMNAPIQGTAADMMKLAMLRVRDVIDGTDIKMLMSVHDEIVLEVPEGADEKFEAIRQAMADALPLNVPIEVDGKIGYDWYETTPVQSG